MKKTSDEQIIEIEKYLDQNLSAVRIAGIVGVSVRTIFRIKKTNRPDLPIEVGGRPAKLTADDKYIIEKMMRTGKWKNAVDAQKQLKEQLGIQVNPETVRRVIRTNCSTKIKNLVHKRDKLERQGNNTQNHKIKISLKNNETMQETDINIYSGHHKLIISNLAR